MVHKVKLIYTGMAGRLAHNAIRQYQSHYANANHTTPYGNTSRTTPMPITLLRSATNNKNPAQVGSYYARGKSFRKENLTIYISRKPICKVSRLSRCPGAHLCACRPTSSQPGGLQTSTCADGKLPLENHAAQDFVKTHAGQLEVHQKPDARLV